MQRSKSTASRLPAARRPSAQQASKLPASHRRIDAAVFSSTDLPEAPPAYATVPSAPVSPTSRTANASAEAPARRSTMAQRQRQTVEDPLASLARFKLVFLLDDSPSMDGLWDELRQALMGTVRAAIKHQRGGMDIVRSAIAPIGSCFSTS